MIYVLASRTRTRTTRLMSLCVYSRTVHNRGNPTRMSIPTFVNKYVWKYETHVCMRECGVVWQRGKGVLRGRFERCKRQKPQRTAVVVQKLNEILYYYIPTDNSEVDDDDDSPVRLHQYWSDRYVQSSFGFLITTTPTRTITHASSPPSKQPLMITVSLPRVTVRFELYYKYYYYNNT